MKPRFSQNPQRKKKNVLSMKEKCEIIQRVEEGLTIANAAKEYQVSRHTISFIKQNKEKILQYSAAIGADIFSRKTIQRTDNFELDAVVFKWYVEQRNSGIPVSNQMIMDGAKQLNEQLQIHPNFRATKDWVRRFKSRHEIFHKYSKPSVPKDDKQIYFDATQNFDGAHTSEFLITQLDDDDVEKVTKTEQRIKEEEPLDIIDCYHVKEEDPMEVIDIDDDDSSVEEIGTETVTDNDTGLIRGNHCETTDEEAFNALESVIEWAETHLTLKIDELMFLRTLQSTAAKRALSSK